MRSRKLLIGAALALIAVVVLALWSWREGAEQRAIGQLPADERAELYRRELGSFRTLCGQGPREDELQKQCKDKAQFIVEFPECDEECHRLAASHMDVGGR
jgi:hypothetical protein